jgi:hypothetical protein
MREELGDVLLQVIFHAQLAEEAGRFDLEGVAREINDKLIRRHPHVFGDGKLSTSDEVIAQWDKIKEGEKQAAPKIKRPPPALPALLQATEAVKQHGKVDRPLPLADGGDGARRLGLSLTHEELGRRLFELAVAARAAGLDPESALRDYARQSLDAIESESGA